MKNMKTLINNDWVIPGFERCVCLVRLRLHVWFHSAKPSNSSEQQNAVYALKERVIITALYSEKVMNHL